MKFRVKFILSHIIVSLTSAVISILLINYFVRYFFIRIFVGKGVSIIIPEAGTRFLNNVKFVILISGLISVIIGFVLALSISEYILKPIIQMKEFARRISQGDFKARLKKNTDDEIGELTESLNYMAFHLGEIESMRTKLMQNISHDLRTPLSSIKGYLEVLIDESFSNEEKENAKEIIRKEIEKMEKMTKDLTKLSTADSKALPLEFEKVNLTNILKETFNAFKLKIEEKGIKGILLLEDEDIYIMGDVQKLKEIFSNLLDNALKFTMHGYIKVKLSKEKDKAVVEIRDTGIGIKEKDLPLIFDRFYKVHVNSDDSGLGLGLSIVKEYTYAHNGELEVKSEENVGSTFILKFKIVN
ncbi:MAG: HAMP domain-containing histidine kinase [Caldisericaceae bacterium]